MISAIVLAAGKSERMGTNKLLLPYQCSVIIDLVIQHILESGIREIIVVLGHEAEKVREEIISHFGRKVLLAFNVNYQQGMLSSIQCGLKIVDPQCEAVFLCLGDQPKVSIETYRQILNSFSSSDKGIIIPTYKGKRGHPILIARRHFPFILTLDQLTASLHSLIKENPDDIAEIELADEGILFDLDHPADYDLLLGSGHHGKL